MTHENLPNAIGKTGIGVGGSWGSRGWASSDIGLFEISTLEFVKIKTVLYGARKPVISINLGPNFLLCQRLFIFQMFQLN